MPLKLSHVQHVHTVIQGHVRTGESVLRYVDALHPTPALGGSPRHESAVYLHDTEHLERGWYGGPIGWLDAKGDGIFRVAIRSALVTGHHAITYAGAGIIDGSDPATEWTETEFKMKAMQQALAAWRDTLD